MKTFSLENELHQHGLRATLPRTLVLRVLKESPRHFTTEQLWRSIQDTAPDIERSTVYRVIQALFDAGLVGQTLLPNGVKVVEAESSHHAHWICTRCQTIQHFSERIGAECAGLLEHARQEAPHLYWVEMVGWGVCGACDSAPPPCGHAGS